MNNLLRAFFSAEEPVTCGWEGSLPSAEDFFDAGFLDGTWVEAEADSESEETMIIKRTSEMFNQSQDKITFQPPKWNASF